MPTDGGSEPHVLASVIVPTFRGAHRLPHLLAQLERQVVAGAWELVVVVDGSSDGTPQLLEAWRHRLPLTVIANPQAQGVAAALTRGFTAARGEYLIRCDDDLDVRPSFVSDHLAVQAGADDVVALALTRDLFPRTTPYTRAYGEPANLHHLAACYAEPDRLKWVHLAACFSLHRRLWEASGGFDPRFAYGEDSEFGYRLWTSGARFLIDRALEVGHRGPATSAATRVPRAYVSGASRRLFNAVHPDAPRPDGGRRGLRSRAWNALVKTVSITVRRRASYAALGRAADRVLAVTPPVWGGRLVALLVEAAGRSGLHHGSADLHSYRGQKDVEMDRELHEHERSRPAAAETH